MQRYKNSVLCKGLFTLFLMCARFFILPPMYLLFLPFYIKNVRSTCKNTMLSVGEFVFSLYICSTEMSYLSSTTLYNTSQK